MEIFKYAFCCFTPFAFELGVSLSHFISYSSYQPGEVSAVICAFQARARRGEGSNLPGLDRTGSLGKKRDLRAQAPPSSLLSESAEPFGFEPDNEMWIFGTAL